MTETLALSPPRDDERALLVAMMRDFNAHEAIPWTPAIERALGVLLGDPSLGRVWLIRDGSAVVGYAVLTFGFDLEYGGRDAFMTELYVVPEARSRGVGRRALAQIDRLARESGVGAIHLVVRHDNAPARAVYRRAGFEESPRLLMTRRLDGS